MKQNKVASNLPQNYTATEKAQARLNIGAADSSLLASEIQRATDAEKAAKSVVVAGPGISVSTTTAQDGHFIYTVGNSGSGLYKTLQNEIDQPYADYGFIKRLRQQRNGEVSIECSYISAATQDAMGLMSTVDKSKLDGIQNGAEVNQNAFTNIRVGSSTLIADEKTDTLSLIAGTGISLTPNVANDSVTIAASASAQVQSNWTETDTTNASFIQNKPNLRYKAAGASTYDSLTGMTVDRTATVTDLNINIASIAFQGSSIAAGYLVPGLWRDFLDSASTNYGDSNHPAFIQHDSYGRLYFKRGQRTFWEFNYTNPTVTLTAQDISRGYAEFPLALTSDGLKIVNNNDMITIKGHNISLGNILNGKNLSLYLKPHGSPDDIGWFICDGMTTYTETVVSNYEWKAFKGWGLTQSNNVSAVDAYLRVPLNGSGSAGDTYRIDGKLSVSIFGVAKDDPT